MNRCLFCTQPAVDLPASKLVDVPLAQTGEGIAECELLKWYVQEVSQSIITCFVPSLIFVSRRKKTVCPELTFLNYLLVRIGRGIMLKTFNRSAKFKVIKLLLKLRVATKEKFPIFSAVLVIS